MKSLPKLIALLTLGFLATAAHFAFAAETKSAESKNCGCKCCVGKEVCCCHVDDAPAATPPATTPAEKEKPAGHPLVGVVVDIMADKQALLVKHEEIPGVMRAMTMLLRVDESGLKAAVKGAPVTGTLIRREKIWWLDDVKVAAKE